MSFIIIILSFGTGGFILIDSVFQTSKNNAVQSVLDNNSYVTSLFYAAVKNSVSASYDESYMNYIIDNFKQQVANNKSDTTVNIGGISDISFKSNNQFTDKLKTNERGYQTIFFNNKKYLQAVSYINVNKTDYYIETLTDITYIYNLRDYYCNIYQVILIFVTLFASLILVSFSLYITKPLVKLSNISQQIANGDLAKRVHTKSKSMNTKEIHQLAENFNIMADNVEKHIELLKQEAQSRDDFVADFTHELKTPLTSVIGYADMLRSYELDAEQRRACADYIYKEGKRLEALSINLLNIIVMKNNDIKLIPIKTSVVFKEIENSVSFLLKKYDLTLKTEIEHSIIMIEPSMFKTMVYNIIDNACKASEPNNIIKLYGFVDCNANKYKIIIQDFGSGIPKNELDKITRPFYMIDKSRSRRLGGAGLGLALCQETAKLHGSELEFESEINKGTKVIIKIQIENLKNNTEI